MSLVSRVMTIRTIISEFYFNLSPGLCKYLVVGMLDNLDVWICSYGIVSWHVADVAKGPQEGSDYG